MALAAPVAPVVSPVRYQARVIRALDRMSVRYGFVTVDAAKPADQIYRELQRHIAGPFAPRKRPAKKAK